STTIRLDPDVLAGLKAKGAGWQTRVNEALRKDLKAGRL
ncbi:MAG: BrnA antitoxin family protein, partial [Xenophilus sp.]